MDDDEEKKPALIVVSDNRHLPDRDERQHQKSVQFAREAAQGALTNLAATLLRTLAGSNSASYDLLRCVRQLVEKQEELRELSGEWMTLGDEREALALPVADLEREASDFQYRRWQRKEALETIVQGALRLAAHQVLGEEPHFGGMHSTRLIERGIAAMNDANRPLPPTKPMSRRELADVQAAEVGLRKVLDKDHREPGRKKRWSSRDSRSYKDLKPEE